MTLLEEDFALLLDSFLLEEDWRSPLEAGMTEEEEGFALLLDFAELLEDFALLLDTLVSLTLDFGVTLEEEDFADSLDFGVSLEEDFTLLLELSLRELEEFVAISLPEQDEGLDPSLLLRMALLEEESSSRGAKLFSSSQAVKARARQVIATVTAFLRHDTKGECRSLKIILSSEVHIAEIYIFPLGQLNKICFWPTVASRTVSAGTNRNRGMCRYCSDNRRYHGRT